MEIVDNTLKTNIKKVYATKEELLKLDLTNSKIIDCIINMVFNDH